MSASSTTQVLIELAELYGISATYHNWRGELVEVAPEVLMAVLAAVDVDASTDESAAEALARAEERPWRNTLPPTTVAREGESPDVFVHVPDGAVLALAVITEDGDEISLEQQDHVVEPRTIDGELTGEAKFRIPSTLPLGWHELRALVGDAQDEFRSALIVTPAQPSKQIAEPAWGIMCQLYQARSEESWGIGDLGDLETLGRWGAERGAEFVLVNPFHAPAVTTPIEPSPYLPTSRRFVDPSLIRIEELAKRESLTETEANRIAELASYGRAINSQDTIDRDASWLAKREALSILFVASRRDNAAAWRQFGAFTEAEGMPLIEFATWCALCEQLGGNWRDWEPEFQDPNTSEVDAFRQEHADRVEFYCWVQFAVREQSLATQDALKQAGMSIGVMHDLAVGSHPSGADAWSLSVSMARGVSVGAPPDAFNQLGQDWSQPPLRPDALEQSGYRPLRDTLRSAFVGAGALRIDHLLGMFRQWWVPAGMSPDQGTYVTFDHEAMLGVILLEAERAEALVIGEDLGNVTDLVRSVMAERRVLGTQIMWFEKEEDGSPKRPENYRVECLATVTTHDLPPTAGYLELEHLRVRETLSLLTRSIEDETAEERALVEGHREQLIERGLLGEDATTDEFVIALHRRLASSASVLFGVALADLAGDRRSINQPGTHREYPNWTLPLAGAEGQVLSLEALLATEHAEELAAAARRQP